MARIRLKLSNERLLAQVITMRRRQNPKDCRPRHWIMQPGPHRWWRKPQSGAEILAGKWGTLMVEVTSYLARSIHSMGPGDGSLDRHSSRPLIHPPLQPRSKRRKPNQPL